MKTKKSHRYLALSCPARFDIGWEYLKRYASPLVLFSHQEFAIKSRRAVFRESKRPKYYAPLLTDNVLLDFNACKPSVKSSF